MREFIGINEKLEVGKRVWELRMKQGYTREVLAERAETSDRFLFDIEQGKKGTSTETLARLAVALNTTADYLLFGSKRGEETIELCLSRVEQEKQKEIDAVFHKILDLMETP